jgi:fatty acid desaturase
MEDAKEKGPYLAYRRALLSSARVRELSRLRPSRALLDAALAWLVIVATWVSVARFPHWWAVALAIPVIGTRYYALWIIGHDGLHRRVFARVKDNDLFTDIAVFGPIGAITRLNNRNHLDHHLHMCTERDPDRHKHGSYNKTTRPALFAFLTGGSSLMRSVKNVFLPKSNADAPGRRYTPRDLAIVLTWQAALIGGLTFGIGWWAWPVLWLLPVYVFTFLADSARAFIEHSHPEDDTLADEHRLITVTSNPLERLFFAPLHMNLHASHHLWPSIPYYNLPLAEREMRTHAAASDLLLRSSYLGYLWTYCASLPHQKFPKPEAMSAK